MDIVAGCKKEKGSGRQVRMVFSSVPFLFYFLPLFLTSYFVLGSVFWRNINLLAFSLVFYAWGEPWFVFLMALSIGFNYVIGLALGSRDDVLRVAALGVGVASNLSFLGFFKYANFVVENWNQLAGHSASIEAPFPSVLPIGISFFTFQAISYLIDVWRRHVDAETNPLHVAVYISMFPQLVAGPIVRFNTVSRQIHKRRSTFGRAAVGLRIFMIGLAQKVLIADEVARIADSVFDQAQNPVFQEAWLGVAAYTVQIYFDFAGYSNMAIGIGIALGFTFPRNFRLPYTSLSITEFWRRWHMSLSAWFRDYLYIPLGGSRGSRLATYRNLVTVFVLCGLWHGASWNFIVWGLHHGAFLVAERVGLGRLLRRAPAAVQWGYTMLAVMSGWVWFRAADLGQASSVFAGLIGLNGAGAMNIPTYLAVYPASLTALVVGLGLATLLRDRTHGTGRPLAALTWVIQPRIAYVSLFIAMIMISVLKVASNTYSPFLYFRF